MDKEKILKTMRENLDEKKFLDLIKKFEKDKKPIEISIEVRSAYIENSGNYILFCPEFSKGQFGEGSDTINRIVHNSCFDEESTVRLIYGDLEIRQIGVKRCHSIDSRFSNDFKLLEGKYNSIYELEERIEELDIFYCLDCDKEKMLEIANLIKNKFRMTPVFPLIHCIGKTRRVNSPVGYPLFLPKPKVCNFLREQKIQFLENNLEARTDGIYETLDEMHEEISTKKLGNIFYSLL